MIELRIDETRFDRSAPRRSPQAAAPSADDERRSRLTLFAERTQSQSHFELLGIGTDASADEIQAYLRGLRSELGAPWQKEHHAAAAAAIAVLATDAGLQLDVT